MLTDFEGFKIAYKDIWDLQTKLTSALGTLQEERQTHESHLSRIRKQEKAIKAFLGQSAALPNTPLKEASRAA